MTDRPRVDILNFNFFDWDGRELMIGGAERYVLELARLVQRLGLEPRIVQNANHGFAREFEGIQVVGVKASRSMDLATMSAGFAGVVRGAALIVASPLELASGLGADGSVTAPIVGINHGIHWDYPNNSIETYNHHHVRSVIDAVRACALCVCVDTNFYNWVRAFDAEAALRLRYVPNFVDLERFRATAKRFDGRLSFLFPRRLCRERGFHDVVEAFDLLLPRHADFDLHLCGTGPEEDEALARAFVERHAGRVRWSQLGMDDMPSAYADSHVVLVPTRFAEGTSLSCIEAMATNNVVVTTPVGGLPNLVVDGHNGILTLPSVHFLVEAIEGLAADRSLCERLATNALTVVPAFARERWMVRWAGLVRGLLRMDEQPLPAGLPRDVHDDVAWSFGLRTRIDELCHERDKLSERTGALERELAALHGAHTYVEGQLAFRESELQSIKYSTGWAVLQKLYGVRFAMFPRGSLRERIAKWVLHRVRRLAPARGSADGAIPSTANAPAADLTAKGPKPRALDVKAGYTIVCLPILEWSFRFQRPQQLARRFASAGYDVLFAKHSFADVLSTRPIEPGIEEIELPATPGLNPYRDRPSDADAQRMADALLDHLAARGTGRFVVVVQLPFWSGVAMRMREVAGCDVVYDCMDLHAGFSSNTDVALADEKQLLRTADLVVCASQKLLDHASSQAKRAILVRNGVDYPHFAAVADRSPAKGALTVGYYGAIADWFDSDLVAGVARLRPHWRIVLIGSTWSADTKPLESSPNVVLLGEKPYTELPALIADWDCCLIPFRHTPLTEATNPVKVYEMLAAGKPVVSVGLPELAPMSEAGLVATVEGANAFVDAIEALVAANGLQASAARRAYAAANTWETRAQAVLDGIGAIEPMVSVIVVTFNNRNLNELCLASLFGDTRYTDYEVIVVDNASKDGTPDLLREWASREPRLSLVLNPDNKGFSAANNQGAAVARGRYLCFLNNDTVVHGDWLRTLVGHLRRHAQLGLVGPVTNAIGNEAKIAVGYQDLAGMPAWVDGHCEVNRGRLTDVSMLAFFCVAMPRWVWHRVGPLDERFGAGMFEDDDYNRRVREAGFDVGLARDSFVHHWQMASFNLLGNDEYMRIYRENEKRYASKWAGGRAADDPLAALRRRSGEARGTVVFAPSVGWAIPLAQRPHHIARALVADGYVVVFDCSNASDDVDVVREVEHGVFLYKGDPHAIADLPRTTLWTFSYNYDYRDAFPDGTTVIYDWIDDLSVFPYEPAKLESMHARALREADVVISVARGLHERAVQERPDARYMPNAVEAGRFDIEPRPNPALADAEFASILAAGRPIAGYYGALARWFDYALLEATAQRRPDWSFVLIGPDHDGSLARSGLARLPNVHWLGPRPYVALPGYLHRFDVATIPFAINEITLATSPLKLYEYFAAGRPVISTPMPECAAFADVQIVRDAAEFAAALDVARTQAGDPGFRQRLHEIAARNTWRARARETMALVEERRVRPPPPILPSAVDPDAVPREIRRRFSHLETKDNRRLFRALSRHFAGNANDPGLPQLVEFAMSANERGRETAKAIDAIVAVAGKRTLDVGCAYGGLLLALAELGSDPTGVETDEALVGIAKENFADAGRRFGVHLADVADAADIARFRRLFDIVTCSDLPQRVADPATYLRHLASMLRPDGRLVVELSNPDDPTVFASGTSRKANAHQLRLDEFRQLLESAGLSMEIVFDPDTVRTPDAIRTEFAKLRKTVLAPELRHYLDEADTAPTRTADDRRRFVHRYGMRSWTIVARPQTEESVASGNSLVDVVPPRSLAHRPFLRGVCNICGLTTRFYHGDPADDREALTCQHCRAISRYRSIARGVLDAIEARTGIRAESVAELPTEAPGVSFRVYETQPAFFTEASAYPVPSYLQKCRWIDLTVSAYRQDKPAGAAIGPGVFNHDLERLTFPDDVFDLVVTSDVMEHVRNDARAHAEIARVLKPGGVYAFTVPHTTDVRETLVRVKVHDADDPSKDEQLMEPEYHGDLNAGDGTGALAYRFYGTAIRDELRALGFDVSYRFEDDELHGIRNAELFYCVKR